MEERHATGIAPLICLLTVGGSIGLTNNVAKLGIAYDVPLIGLLFAAVTGAAILLGILALIARARPRSTAAHCCTVWSRACC